MKQISLRPLILAISCGIGLAQAQVSTRPEIEVHRSPQRFFALKNARVMLSASEVRESATLVIRDGRVVSVLSASQEIPQGATVLDMAGKTLRPAFIDLASTIATDPNQACATSSAMGFTAPQPPPRRGPMPAQAPATGPNLSEAGHWNKLVCPERSVARTLSFDEAQLKALRKQGFAYVLSHENDGVLRGSSALVSLRAGATAAQNLIAADVTQDIAIEQVPGFGGEYPASYMGAIALLRQAFIDARWHAERLKAIESGQALDRPEANRALSALAPLLAKRQALFGFARDELDFERLQKLADEQSLPLVTVGNGFEYRVLNQLSQSKTSLIVPINFPEAPSVEDPLKALEVSLAELEHWRYGAFNLKLLADKNIRFAITAMGLEKPEQFSSNLRTAIRYGLDENKAIAALTSEPAALIGAKSLGRLSVGSVASFSVADSELLSDAKGKIYELWIDGEREIFEDIAATKLAGDWRFVSGTTSAKLVRISDEKSAELVDAGAPAAEKKADAGEAKSKESAAKLALSVEGARVLLHVPKESASVLFGVQSDALSVDLVQQGERLSGRWFDRQGVAHLVSLEKSAAAKTDDKAMPPKALPTLPSVWRYPAGEYGRAGLPSMENLLIQNVTVWISGKDEPESGRDVWIEGGRIKAVGTALDVPASVQRFDAKGMHLSPGLVDAHSHIAANGNVNEGSHAVTSEVRVGDIIDPTDINIYRELAGGTTTSQILHGSANAIGGQAQVIKHRWGASGEELKFAGVIPTIKFALGENPKQSNWGDNFRTRYPQTRLGVEALIRSQFTQAKGYGEALKRDPSTRRDLRLEPLLEILQGKRLVHIHSYRADEILMFARLSQEFGFKIGAYQHVLEGYKVAKEISEVGAGASTFADWWGFKLEAFDAIPQNAAMMVRQGVLVSLNSDSNDLGRRMNTEAAKAMRYGNLSATEALKLVTLYPAKQLRIDDSVGSVEVGKSADLVLWNRSPMSTMARAETVWIDGRRYFDRSADQSEQQRVDQARAELLQLALAERVKSLGGKPESGPNKVALDTRWGTNKHWPSIWIARRGLYHNGEATHFCTDGE